VANLKQRLKPWFMFPTPPVRLSAEWQTGVPGSICMPLPGQLGVGCKDGTLPRMNTCYKAHLPSQPSIVAPWMGTLATLSTYHLPAKSG
jgi:hypothetical protein